MSELSKTEVVYKDLYRLYNKINSSRRHPRAFRNAFESYIFKSQQLTEAMRSEYKKKTQLDWLASEFQGWNGFTNALKRMRNAALHGCPIELDEAAISIYPYVKFAADRDGDVIRCIAGRYRAVQGRSFINDAFSENFTSFGPAFARKYKLNDDPDSPKNYVYPVKEYVFYEFKFDLLDEGVLKDLKEEGRVDALKIVLKSFPVLRRYMIFFRCRLRKNLCDVYQADYFVRPNNGRGWVVNKKYLGQKKDG
tara:strand:- start:934 stop:1686 length:753 start_codon:yes stop_codon:yes gene_type:complete